MGNSHSPVRSRRSSSLNSSRKSTDLSLVSKKIDEKECQFIAMQAEIEKAIAEGNQQAMRNLADEIAAHIMDLSQLKPTEMSTGERGRCQRVKYSYELSLAKLKSILNYDTAQMKKAQQLENSKFYSSVNEPDIVNDLINLDKSCRGSPCPSPGISSQAPTDSPKSLSANGCSSTQDTAKDVFTAVENEFCVLKDMLKRPIEDVNEYYQMDKGVFYLQVQVKNLDPPPGSTLNDKKFGLLKKLAEFRTLLDKKSGELEEQRELTQEVNTLELLVDSSSTKDNPSLKARALKLQKIIEQARWDKHFIGKKIELLRKIGRILERIAFSSSPEETIKSSVNHLYGNINSLQRELDQLKAQEELESIKSIDEVLEQQPECDSEAIYGNIEVFKENFDLLVSTKNTKVPQNGISHDEKKNSSNPRSEKQSKDSVIPKRPLPLPRNYDDKVINELQRNWHRLDDILNSEVVTETDLFETMEIQKHAELARNLFERRIRKIIERTEESIEL